MRKTPLRMLFAVTVIAAAAYVFLTSAQLPDPLASHFALDGRPNGHMPRNAYAAIMTGVTVLIPLLMVFFQIWLPRIAPKLLSIPRRDYWLATAERRALMLDYLERHALVTGLVPPLFFAGMHWLVLHANATASPQLDNTLFAIMTGAFVICIGAAGITLSLRFRRAA